MTQNLQTASQSEQQAESAEAAGHVQDARSLIDHLNSVLSVEADETDAQPAPEQPFPEATSFARAIMRQSDQIQYLVEQISRLDSDTEIARLRDVVVDLCSALAEVILRMKQDSSQAAGKIGVLVDALTIIGGDTPNIIDSSNVEALLSGAKAAADRLASLEGLSKDARAAISALEEIQSRSQNKIRDLSACVIKLNDSVESGSAEIADLHQRIESSDCALAHGLASLGADVTAGRSEITGLQQRIESTDHVLAQGLASLGDEITTDRNTISGLQQQIESTDHALAQGLASLGSDVAASRNDAAGLQQRFESVDRVLAQGLAKLDGSVEEGRKEIDGLRQRIGSFDQVLGQGLVTLNERTTTLRDDLGQAIARIASVEDSNAMYGVFKDKIESLNGRLAELERNSAAEIKSWRLHESERNAALVTKLETLEQKNQSLGQSAEQVAARLNAAEQTIATVVQRQKALSSVHDRVVRLLLANPDLQS